KVHILLSRTGQEVTLRISKCRIRIKVRVGDGTHVGVIQTWARNHESSLIEIVVQAVRDWAIAGYLSVERTIEVGAAEDSVSWIVDDRERQSGLKHCDAGQLPIIQQRADSTRFRLRSRQIVSAADDEPMFAIKVRSAVVGSPVKLIPWQTGELVDSRAVVVIM